MFLYCSNLCILLFFQIIANNLQTVEQFILSLEEQVPISILHKYRKSAISEVRLADEISNEADEIISEQNGDENSKIQKNRDLLCCMAITIAILRVQLQDLSSTFATLKEKKAHKQTVIVSIPSLLFISIHCYLMSGHLIFF